MQENTNNKTYWENYVSYWENKVSDANIKENAKDKTSTDNMMAHQVGRLNLSPADIFLDYGCGSGRYYPYYCQQCKDGKNYNGVDISRTALDHALELYSDLKENQLKETDGVTIPFDDNTFDKISCYGVFDACNQEHTLAELLRVLKIGGILFLTGKNDNYCEDDMEAYVAEVNARKKNHPNSFTDVISMIGQLKKNGVEIVEQFFFERRGDVQKNKFFKEVNDTKFYEWQLLIKKMSPALVSFEKFSDAYSKTFIGR